jgi:hypothetical protein
VTNVYSRNVTTYNPDGTRTNPTINGVNDAYGIAVDKHGKIYVVNSGPSSCTDGIVTTYLPDGTQTTPTIATRAEPVGIAVDSRGKIDANDKIFVVNDFGPPVSGNVTSYLPDGTRTRPTIKKGVSQPYLIAIH